jgi:hypothetical protein
MSETIGVESVHGPGREETAHPVSENGLALSALRPLLEGARARGVADACELLGVGAALLDRSGRVLHVTSAGGALLGSALKLVEEHLVAVDSAANHVVERVVGVALSGSPCEEVMQGSEMSLRLRAAPMPGALDDDAQLLKAVLFLTKIESCEASHDEANRQTSVAA